MKIAIVGAGGIGGYLAAKLTAAGEDVALLARGTQLEAIRAGGLTLVDPAGDLTVRPAILTDEAGALGTPDLIVLAVKAHQLGAAIGQIAPVVGPATRLLPFQNGVDAPDMLADAFGPDRALIGVARFFANITAPRRGHALWRAAFVHHRHARWRTRRRRRYHRRAPHRGRRCPRPPRYPRRSLDQVHPFNALSSITAGTRKRFGELRVVPEAVALIRRLMTETHAVGAASGVPLDPALVDACMNDFLNVVPAEGRTSTAHDLEAGRALEIDHICGAVARRGRALGLDVSASETVYALLRPWRDG